MSADPSAPPPPRNPVSNRTGYVFVAALLLGASAALAWAIYRGVNGGIQRAPQDKPLVVGYQTSPAMALIMVAQARKLFKSNVQLKEFQAGKLALQAFLGGSLDVAVAGDVPIGLALLQGQRPVAFAEVVEDSTDEVRMIVRGPCDSAKPQAYFMRGAPKLIATSFGGGPQYFAVKFLESNGVPLERAKLQSYAPAEIPAAMDSNSIDGAAIFDPAAARIERSLGTAGCTFKDPLAYRQHYIAVAKPDLINNRRVDSRLVDFVLALRSAQQFISADPATAKSIVLDKTGIDPQTLDALWPRLKFGVTLDESLPTLWMQEADFYTRQPGATVVNHQPDYKAAISMAAMR